MKKIIKNLFVLCLVLANASNMFGQFIGKEGLNLDYLNERWAEFQQQTNYSLLDYSRKYFMDTVSVKEMKEAFYKFKDTKYTTSPYQGLDSVKRNGTAGERVILLSPLKNHPQKEVRNCRGVWKWFGVSGLETLLDKKGVPQEALCKKIKEKDLKNCMNGDFVTLISPRWYMGFAVSPVASINVFQNGEQTVSIPSVMLSDFYSYAGRYPNIVEGQWYHRVVKGTTLLGVLQSMNTMKHTWVSEKTFSVLLYAKTYERNKKITYTVDLLLPENPDNETLTLYKEFKYFVESLPSKSFAPYYTTDMRLMTGRYYKVTVSKYGWLIEDYLNISQ